MCLLILGTLIAGFNTVVDPQARFLIVDKHGFNQIKVALPRSSRKSKATALRQCGYDALVLGTSRAETAISMDHPAFSNTNAYNASLRAGTIYEMRRLIEYGMQQGELKFVVLSLDYESFNSRKSFAEDFPDSPLAESTSIESAARYLFSNQTLGQSITTLQQNISGTGVLCADRGEHVRTYELDAARVAFDFILSRYAEGHYGKYVPGDIHMQHFDALLRELADANVATYAYLSPMHATHLELIAEMGLRDDYESWKRQLVQIVADVNRDTPARQPIVLWDFSGYSEITTESVPDPKIQKHMRWFEDSSHVNAVVGDIMLEKMFRGPATAADVEFGVVLTPANIDAQIEADRRGSELYQLTAAEELLRLQQMLGSLEY